jgi:hypothetical protein
MIRRALWALAWIALSLLAMSATVWFIIFAEAKLSG